MKIKLFFMFLMLCLTVGIAVALPQEIEVRKLSKIESFWQDLKPEDATPFYISGGSFSEQEVLKGDEINVKVNIKFTEDATLPDLEGRYVKLEMYWVDESLLYTGETVNDNELRKVVMGTYYLRNPYKKGDWIEITIKNAKTGKMDDSYCSKGIKFVGNHYNWMGYVWKKDGNFNLVQQKSMANFLLKCKEDNPCGTETKDLGYICKYDNERWMRQQTPYLQSDGTCFIKETKVPCNVGYICKNGVCIEEKVCDSGDTRCSFNGLTQDICKNNAWESDKVCEDGCSYGTCNEDKENNQECVGEDGKNCETQETGATKPEDEKCTQPCSKDYVCSDGSILAKCVDNCYVRKMDRCPIEENKPEENKPEENKPEENKPDVPSPNVVDNSCTTSSCTKDYVCSDGKTILAKCVNGCYEKILDSCPTVPGSNGGNPETWGEISEKTTTTEKIMIWIEENPIITALMTFVVIFAGMMLYNSKRG
jgi:hypothetical protein